MLLLNVLLVAAVAWSGIELRNEWRAARAREAATLNRRLKPAPPPPFTRLPAAPPVLAAGFADVAQKDLFDPSRNPTVVVEAVQAPAPPPMPALPVYYGMMNIGTEGPIAIFSLGKGAPQKAIHPGEEIGPFKLVGVNNDEVTLAWNGQEVHKKVYELAVVGGPAVEAEAAPLRTEGPAPAAAAAPAPVKSGPGEASGLGQSKTCAVNDGHAEGDVVDGYRKTVFNTPFGKSCLYEPAGK